MNLRCWRRQSKWPDGLCRRAVSALVIRGLTTTYRSDFAQPEVVGTNLCIAVRAACQEPISPPLSNRYPSIRVKRQFDTSFWAGLPRQCSGKRQKERYLKGSHHTALAQERSHLRTGHLFLGLSAHQFLTSQVKTTRGPTSVGALCATSFRPIACLHRS